MRALALATRIMSGSGRLPVIPDVTVLHECIAAGGAWELDGRRGFVCIDQTVRTQESRHWQVPTSLLASLHPDLPAALRCTFAAHRPRLVVPASCVAATLRHYTNPWPVNTVFDKAIWLLKITGIAFAVPANTDRVLLYADHYRLSSDRPAGMKPQGQHVVPYVEGVVSDWLTIPAAWLDDQYPGWRNRLITADAMGLTDDAERVAFVFTRPEPAVSTCVDLTVVQFE